MKKIAIAILTLTTVLFSLFSGVGCSSSNKGNNSGTEGLEYQLIAGLNEYCVTGIGTATDTDIKIPSTYQGKKVTQIADEAFSGNKNLTSVEIGDWVRSIGYMSFYGSSNLTEIKFGKRLQHIGEYAFLYSGIESIELPNSLIVIDEGAFSSCTKLTSIEFGNSLTHILTAAFYKCNSLTSVEIPNSVTTIGKGAFSECKSLTSVEIPNSVTSIGDETFYKCNSLTSIEIPNSVTSIGSKAFSECNSLTSVKMGSGLTSVGEDLFWGTTIENYKVDGNLKYLGTKNNPYFYLAGVTSTDITTAEINDDCAIIGSRAFSGCDKLTSIEIPESVKVFGARAFNNSRSENGLFRVNYLGTIDQWAEIEANGDFSSPLYSYNNVEFTIKGEQPASNLKLTTAKKIGNYAFYNCKWLTSVEIGDSVTQIGSYAFYNCDNLTAIILPERLEYVGDEVFRSIDKLNTTEKDGCVYLGNKDNPYMWLLYMTNVAATSVTINPNCKIIGSHAFGFSNIVSVDIPDSVEFIGCRAFEHCESLSSLTMGDGVKTIDNLAFYGSHLAVLKLGNNVTNIGNNLLEFSNISCIVIPETLKFINKSVFITNMWISSMKVCYAGTYEEWCENFYSVTRYSHTALYCYSKREPNDEGNYWHYDENGEVAFW